MCHHGWNNEVKHQITRIHSLKGTLDCCITCIFSIIHTFLINRTNYLKFVIYYSSTLRDVLEYFHGVISVALSRYLWHHSHTVAIRPPTKTNRCLHHFHSATSSLLLRAASSQRRLTVGRARWAQQARWRLHEAEGKWTGRAPKPGTWAARWKRAVWWIWCWPVMC